MLTGRSVAWSSLNTAVATVSISGLVTAMAPGNAVIRATVESKTGDATVVVNAPAAPVSPATAASVVVTFDSSSISTGHTSQAKAIAKDAQGNILSGKAASWISKTTGVASVSGTGVVTGTTTGTAVIQATIDGVPGSGSLSVMGGGGSTPPPPASTLAISAVTLNRNPDGAALAPLSAGTTINLATLPTRDVNIAATVAGTNPIGRVDFQFDAFTHSEATAPYALCGDWATCPAGTFSVGSHTLTVTPFDASGAKGTPAVLNLRVIDSAGTSPPTVSVVVSFDSTSVAVGHTSQARAVAKDASGAPIPGKTATWQSQSTGIASVGLSSGIVLGVSSGTAVIQATIDGVKGTGSLLVTPANVISAPAPSGSVSQDFETGTLGSQFTNNTGGQLAIMSDPAGGGHGKVGRIHYSVTTDGVNLVDDNRAITPNTLRIGLGDSLWFQGDFYIPADARMDASGPGNVQRKLLYWGPLDLESGSHGFAFVLSSFGPQWFVTKYPHVGAPSPQDGWPRYIDPAVSAVTSGAWHRLKVQLRANSSFTAQDGVLRVWVDGVLLTEATDVTWTDPTVWANNSPSDFAFTNFGVGYQVNAQQSVDEYRYWDNLIFSRTPIP
jgi:hypothetical protein